MPSFLDTDSQKQNGKMNKKVFFRFCAQMKKNRRAADWIGIVRPYRSSASV